MFYADHEFDFNLSFTLKDTFATIADRSLFSRLASCNHQQSYSLSRQDALVHEAWANAFGVENRKKAGALHMLQATLTMAV